MGQKKNRLYEENIIHTLDQALHVRLVLIVAPAGSGKTISLRKWANGIAQPVVWLSLSDADNDPVQFYVDLAQAFRFHPSHENRDFPKQGNTAGDGFVDAVIHLMNFIADSQDEIVVVFDGYQVIQEAAIHRAISLLLDYLPPQMHVVIASRTEPPLPLPRLRVRRQMVEFSIAAHR